MTYWLMKSEPFKYSWAQLTHDKRTHWDGVRNYQAAANLRAMHTGDHAFFYHSNEGKEIVGIVEIVKTAYPDPSDETGKFVMVDVAPLKTLRQPVSLASIKSHPQLAGMALLRQSRLSVCPVLPSEWELIVKLSES